MENPKKKAKDFYAVVAAIAQYIEKADTGETENGKDESNGNKQ